MQKKEFKEVMNGLFEGQKEHEEQVQAAVVDDFAAEEKRGRGRPSRSIEDKLGRKISLNIDGELKAYLDWVQREYKVNMAQYIRSLVTADMRHNEEYRGK